MFNVLGRFAEVNRDVFCVIIIILAMMCSVYNSDKQYVDEQVVTDFVSSPPLSW